MQGSRDEGLEKMKDTSFHLILHVFVIQRTVLVRVRVIVRIGVRYKVTVTVAVRVTVRVRVKGSVRAGVSVVVSRERAHRQQDRMSLKG